MLLHIVAFAAGLVVGWNFLPQPAWVLDIITKIKGKIDG